jgi:hypothetical protein
VDFIFLVILEYADHCWNPSSSFPFHPPQLSVRKWVKCPTTPPAVLVVVHRTRTQHQPKERNKQTKSKFAAEK